MTAVGAGGARGARDRAGAGGGGGALPKSLAEVYRLRASGLSYEEMAEVLAVPLGTVKSRMHQMVAELRKEMQAWTAHE